MDYVNSVDMAWFFGGGCVYLIVTVGCFRLLVCSFDGSLDMFCWLVVVLTLLLFWIGR